MGEEVGGGKLPLRIRSEVESLADPKTESLRREFVDDDLVGPARICTSAMRRGETVLVDVTTIEGPRRLEVSTRECGFAVGQDEDGDGDVRPGLRDFAEVRDRVVCALVE